MYCSTLDTKYDKHQYVQVIVWWTANKQWVIDESKLRQTQYLLILATKQSIDTIQAYSIMWKSVMPEVKSEQVSK